MTANPDTEAQPSADAEVASLSLELLEAGIADGSIKFSLLYPNNSLMVNGVAERGMVPHIEVHGEEGDVAIAAIDRMPNSAAWPVDRAAQAMYAAQHGVERLVLVRGNGGMKLGRATTNTHMIDTFIPPTTVGEPGDHFAEVWDLPWGDDPDGRLFMSVSANGQSVVLSPNYAVKEPAGLTMGKV
jgi:hypothetical protein